MLILALVLGAVAAGAIIPPAPAAAGPLGCPVFPFPEDGLDLGRASFIVQTGHLSPPAPSPNWADHLARVVYRGILRPVMKLLLLL